MRFQVRRKVAHFGLDHFGVGVESQEPARQNRSQVPVEADADNHAQHCNNNLQI